MVKCAWCVTHSFRIETYCWSETHHRSIFSRTNWKGAPTKQEITKKIRYCKVKLRNHTCWHHLLLHSSFHFSRQEKWLNVSTLVMYILKTPGVFSFLLHSNSVNRWFRNCDINTWFPCCCFETLQVWSVCKKWYRLATSSRVYWKYFESCKVATFSTEQTEATDYINAAAINRLINSLIQTNLII